MVKNPNTCHPCKSAVGHDGAIECVRAKRWIISLTNLLKHGWPSIPLFCPKKHKLKRMRRRIKRFFRSIFGGKT